MIRIVVFLLSIIFGVIGYGSARFGFSTGFDSPLVSSIAVVIIALPAVWGLLSSTKLSHGIAIIAGLYLIGTAMETLCLLTGFPYGGFIYTGVLDGVKLFNTTPVLVGLIWGAIVVSAFSFTAYLISDSKKEILFLAVYTTILVVFDAIMDPGAVSAGMWKYEPSGIYYGVPLSNFAGWILTGSISYAVVRLMNLRYPGGIPGMSRALPFYTAGTLLVNTAFWTGVAAYYSMLIPLVLGLLFAVFLTLKTTTR